MDEKKRIVDSNGNVLESTKENQILKFLKINIWNIMSIGLPAFVTIVGIFKYIASKSFSNSCAVFYGMDRKYFSGTEMLEDKIFFLFCALVLFLVPFIMSYMNMKINSKIETILFFVVTALVLFAQNIAYTVGIIEIIPFDWLRSIIDYFITVGVFFVSDLLISYFLILRNVFKPKKKYSSVENIVMIIALIVFASNMVMGVTIELKHDISDKKVYEVIEQDRAIISNYNNKFVVMDCEIHDETLTLKKGTYSLVEMTGVKITYHEYEEVICE